MIEMTVERAAERFGLERLGFLTLTFADPVTDKREAQRRFNSLASNVLAERYGRRWMVVWERQRSGRLHAHLLVVLEADIRTGCDFEAFARRDYRSAPAALRREWKYWRETAPKYRFGRTELLPIRSTAGGMATYVGKYLGKDVRQDGDAGVRRYSVAAGLKVANQHHQSAHASHWRKAVGLLAEALARRVGCPATWEGVNGRLGGDGRWMFVYREELVQIAALLRRAGEGEARALARRVALEDAHSLAQAATRGPVAERLWERRECRGSKLAARARQARSDLAPGEGRR